MNREYSTEELLEQLEQETQISFCIEDGQDMQQVHTQLTQMLKALRSAGSRPAFLQRVLLKQIDDLDIQAGLRRFHIRQNERRALLLIRFQNPVSPLELSILGHIYSPASCDIIPFHDREVVLLKTLAPREDFDLASGAFKLCAILETDAMQKAAVSYDEICPSFDALADCYKNTALAMEIGQTFFSQQNVYAYSRLGLGALLYQLPREACLAYLKRSLPAVDFRSFDNETLQTIKTFLSCNLSIAETARNLYMHRNTLVYRLDTIKKLTGLDLRNFKDAMTFQIGLLLWEMLQKN